MTGLGEPSFLQNSPSYDLKLNPLIRYVNTLKAANTVPPSYEVRLVNGASFMVYLEEFSLMVKIVAERYYLGDMDERSQAIDDINRLLTDPQFNANTGEEGGEDSGEEETFDEPAEEPAEEEPEA